jgi:TonB family protein
MHRHGLTRPLCSFAALVLAVATPLLARASGELEQHLRDEYHGKTLVLRNFYHGDRLRYDSAGMPVTSAASGDWTVDGFARVTSLDLHGKKLTIQAQRLSLGNTGKSFQFQQYFDKDKKKDEKEEEKAEKEHRLRVEIDFDAGGITAEKADAALSRIFLTAQDRFAELVPDYWNPCVLAASTGKSIEPAATVGSSQNWRTLPTGGKQYDACSFPPEFAAIPGVVYSSEGTLKSDAAGDGEANPAELPTFRLGKGVSPPKPISNKDPEFSEQARSAKYQGTVVLSLVVDKMGQVRNIRVLRPLGFGLDQKAVETVSKWQFKPGTKDGEPVAVELAVEVDFHLY